MAVTAPIARACIGKSIGDVVEVETAVVNYEIEFRAHTSFLIFLCISRPTHLIEPVVLRQDFSLLTFDVFLCLYRVYFCSPL